MFVSHQISRAVSSTILFFLFSKFTVAHWHSLLFRQTCSAISPAPNKGTINWTYVFGDADTKLGLFVRYRQMFDWSANLTSHYYISYFLAKYR